MNLNCIPIIHHTTSNSLHLFPYIFIASYINLSHFVCSKLSFWHHCQGQRFISWTLKLVHVFVVCKIRIELLNSTVVYTTHEIIIQPRDWSHLPSKKKWKTHLTWRWRQYKEGEERKSWRSKKREKREPWKKERKFYPIHKINKS